jgi:type 1 glutamine amidotransferase
MSRGGSVMVAIGALAGWITLVAACSERQPGTPSRDPQPSSPARVVMLTATSGFRHGSIGTATTVMAELASHTNEFTLTATEDIASITAARLASADVLMFAMTTGELAFDAGQRAAILDFVTSGGGFIGIHSASDTLYTWPEYGQLVGAYFDSHPWTQQARVIVEDPGHPAAAPVAPSFEITEEFYVFRENPRSRVRVLLTLDPRTVNASGDFPLAWSQEIGKGRSYYNALGHFDETWRDARFQAQLRGAISWVARR